MFLASQIHQRMQDIFEKKNFLERDIMVPKWCNQPSQKEMEWFGREQMHMPRSDPNQIGLTNSHWRKRWDTLWVLAKKTNRETLPTSVD